MQHPSGFFWPRGAALEPSNCFFQIPNTLEPTRTSRTVTSVHGTHMLKSPAGFWNILRQRDDRGTSLIAGKAPNEPAGPVLHLKDSLFKNTRVNLHEAGD